MVLIKYSGKYVKIYFNMKITFSDCFCKKKKIIIIKKIKKQFPSSKHLFSVIYTSE